MLLVRCSSQTERQEESQVTSMTVMNALTLLCRSDGFHTYSTVGLHHLKVLVADLVQK